ncbi:MAG: DUF166 domain-containing protein [Candidatus Methanospirareceae archaeon]
MRLLILYSGEFGERIIGNMLNYPSFCKSCGSACVHCKYGKYSYGGNIAGVIELPNPDTMPPFVDNFDTYLPRELPSVDIIIATGIHQDILLELPFRLRGAGIKGLIVPIESPKEVSLGLRRQIEEKCEEEGVESAFPKPFCSLAPEESKPLISKFVEEFRVGKPLLEVKTKVLGGKEVISDVTVVRSAPCGSTWFVARKLIGTEVSRRKIWDKISEAHHSYPCTASMERDVELKDTILHKAGYLIREAVDKALGFE